MPFSQELFEGIFNQVIKEGASDLHLVVGHRPTLRVDGSLIPLLKQEILAPEVVSGFISAMLKKEQREKYEQEKELDFSFDFQGKARFRVNTFHERGFPAAALRQIQTKIRTFEELGMPPALKEFAQHQQGFLLVVGPTGHGKSTTLAAFIDYINRSRADHIVTLEDPIEYIFTSDKSIISQREIGADSPGFSRALRSLMREDADVAMVGEMRDAETMAMAVTAAETGHFILSTLHTNSAAQTVDRIIDTFPPAQQNQIRAQLASTLIGIVSQRLIPKLNGGLVPAVEIMIANSAIRTLIRENKIHQIDLVIETSLDQGMIGLNRSLLNLVRKGDINLESALSYSLNPNELQTLLRG